MVKYLLIKGLIKNKHYIEIDIINDNLILNNQEYKNFFNDINYMTIAQNGYDYIKKKYNSSNFIKEVLKIIK